jgi:maltose O-acetyltransferase
MARSVSELWYHAHTMARARWHLRRADQLGSMVRLRGTPRVVNDGTMIIGHKVRLDSRAAAIELVAESGGTLELEERVFVNFGCNLAASKLIRIGARSLLGPYCMLMDNAYHSIDPDRRDERPDSEPIVLEPNVWLGARTIVLPGVTIGRDSCIGAGSVVTKDVPPRTLAAGVPAKPIRTI